jgi:hypothetical protein
MFCVGSQGSLHRGICDLQYFFLRGSFGAYAVGMDVNLRMDSFVAGSQIVPTCLDLQISDITVDLFGREEAEPDSTVATKWVLRGEHRRNATARVPRLLQQRWIRFRRPRASGPYIFFVAFVPSLTILAQRDKRQRRVSRWFCDTVSMPFFKNIMLGDMWGSQGCAKGRIKCKRQASRQRRVAYLIGIGELSGSVVWVGR